MARHEAVSLLVGSELVGRPSVTRPCAVVFLRSGDRVLVSEMVHQAEGTFYRPPGGGIEFQEHSREAAARELREEFDLELVPDDLMHGPGHSIESMTPFVVLRDVAFPIWLGSLTCILGALALRAWQSLEDR